ncbi:Hypothetical_protein [Hexamita inflata]|uniref:Hypothetical_protein n=1 Tax=Hexamita inflata TaxID=28002 RepID=A0AA86UGW9_9EUKA|nr:Hypothetical protein HINF_LOCUS39031 [Hexamita inflata]
MNTTAKVLVKSYVTNRIKSQLINDNMCSVISNERLYSGLTIKMLEAQQELCTLNYKIIQKQLLSLQLDNTDQETILDNVTLSENRLRNLQDKQQVLDMQIRQIKIEMYTQALIQSVTHAEFADAQLSQLEYTIQHTKNSISYYLSEKERLQQEIQLNQQQLTQKQLQSNQLISNRPILIDLLQQNESLKSQYNNLVKQNIELRINQPLTVYFPQTVKTQKTFKKQSFVQFVSSQTPKTPLKTEIQVKRNKMIQQVFTNTEKPKTPIIKQVTYGLAKQNTVNKLSIANLEKERQKEIERQLLEEQAEKTRNLLKKMLQARNKKVIENDNESKFSVPVNTKPIQENTGSKLLKFKTGALAMFSRTVTNLSKTEATKLKEQNSSTDSEDENILVKKQQSPKQNNSFLEKFQLLKSTSPKKNEHSHSQRSSLSKHSSITELPKMASAATIQRNSNATKEMFETPLMKANLSTEIQIVKSENKNLTRFNQAVERKEFSQLRTSIDGKYLQQLEKNIPFDDVKQLNEQISKIDDVNKYVLNYLEPEEPEVETQFLESEIKEEQNKQTTQQDNDFDAYDQSDQDQEDIKEDHLINNNIIASQDEQKEQIQPQQINIQQEQILEPEIMETIQIVQQDKCDQENALLEIEQNIIENNCDVQSTKKEETHNKSEENSSSNEDFDKDDFDE